MNNGMPNLADMKLVLPELIWCVFGVFIMLLQPFLKNRHFFTFLGLVGALGGTAFSIVSAWNYGPGFSGLILSDAFSLFFHLLLGTIAFLVILASESYLESENLDSPEFLALVLFATAGMGVLASAQELLTGFIGLEMSSISSYILAGYRRDAIKSSEAALKYFLLGSFATAFFLFGIALFYGATGTTTFTDAVVATPQSAGFLKLGLALILIGLGFKVAVAPFQVWTPDVYEGAPTPVTALFSAAPKAAAFALLLRIFATVPAATHYWFWAFWILAALTMFLGNLGALLQSNVKRMLAYSSIANAGYILVGFAAVTSMAAEKPAAATSAYAAVLFYLLGYGLVNVGAFTIVSQLGGRGEKQISLDDYAGLGQRQPLVAAALSVFLLSLLGLPVTAGFFGKFYVFTAAIHSHLIWLAVLMAINGTIGVYYYLRLMVIMYMHEPEPGASIAPVRFPIAVRIVLVLTVAGILYFGVAPTRALNFLNQSTLIGSLK